MTLPQDRAFPTYRNLEFQDRRLRRKDDTATDDADWAALQVDPNSFTETFGAPADGNFILTITPVSSDVTPATLTTTRTAGVPASATDMATQRVADVNTDLALGASSVLAPFIRSVSSSGAAVTYIVRPDAPEFVPTVPGAPSTVTIAPDDTFPITAIASNHRGHHAGHPDAIALAFLPVDASGDLIDDDTGCTLNVELVRVVERRFQSDYPNQDARPVGVTSSTTATAHVLTDELRIPFHGGRFGVRIDSVTLPPTGLDAIEVWWREVIT